MLSDFSLIMATIKVQLLYRLSDFIEYVIFMPRFSALVIRLTQNTVI